MWNDLIFNEPLIRAALKQADIVVQSPLHWIKIGNSDSSSHKVIFLAFNEEQNHPAFVLKSGRQPEDHDRLKAEYTLQRKIFEIKLDVPIVANPIGFFITQNYPVMLEEWLPGITLLRSLYLRPRVDKPRMKYEVETIINHLLIPIQQATLNPTFSWNLAALLNDALEQIKSSEFNLTLPAQVEQKLRGLAQQYPAQKIPCTGAHGDFWPGNILMTQDHFKILDWETYESQSNPFHDLFFFLVTYAMDIRWQRLKRISSVDAVIHAFTGMPWFVEMIRGVIRAFCEVYALPRDVAFLLLAVFYFKMAVSTSKSNQNPSDWHTLAQDFVNHHEKYHLLFTDGEDKKW